ncbi:hypothetical protein RB653_005191 [Dictyostelium firmibasis]|uniref:RRM domain-containing protein n=1 Tax=Dictyostelium firmibasis TaxID=79012 RepID=A0AAN7UKL9_9MYCE
MMSNINDDEYDDEEMKLALKGDADSSSDDSDSDENNKSNSDDDSDSDIDSDDSDNMESKTDYENSSEGLEVGILEIKLREDPYSFEKNVTYINALSKFTKQSNYQTLREAREKFQSIHPLTQEIWLTWLSDEQKYMKNTDNDKQYILSLYEKALNDFISVKINLSYCRFIIKINTISGLINNIKEIRERFEKSLEQCGEDIMESPLLWTEYRMFEQMLLSQIKDENDKQIQIKTIRNLYHRQLSEPMIGLELIYNDYQQWEDSQQTTTTTDNEKDEKSLIQLKYEKSLKQFKEREPFEQSLKEKKYLDQRKWKEYIEFEKQHGKPMRVVALFERQLKYFSNHYSIWSFYLTYIEKVIKLNDLRLKVFSRSLRSIYYSGEHWSKYLLLLEESISNDNDDSDKEIKEKIEQEFQRSLISGLKSEYDYQLVYNTYIDYHWRSIIKNLSKKEEADLDKISDQNKQFMKSLFETMNNHMSAIDVNGYTTVDRYMYIAQFEWRQFNDIFRYREIVDYVLSIDPSQYWIWNQYISFEMEQRQFHLVRELFKKASNQIRFDDPSSRLWQDWFTFERGNGTIDQYKLVSDRYSNSQNKYNQEQEKYLQQQQKQKLKRKEKNTDENNNDQRESKKQKKENNEKSTTSNGNEDKKVGETDGNNEFKKPLAPSSKKQKEKDLPKKLIILNLPFDTVEADLHKIFDKYGYIKSLKLILDKNGKSKGICFILYKTNESANKALEMDQQTIKNRTICVQYSKDQHNNEQEETDETLTPTTSASIPTTTTTTSSTINEIDFDNHIGLTVFINNLSPGVNKEKLEQFLQHNGVTGIKDVRVVLKTRPFAYVDLTDKENLKKALSLDKKYFMSKSINVNLSKPPSSSISPANNNITTNGNHKEFEELPIRKPTLLVPRGIKNKK